MSHLAHIVKLKQALIVEGINAPGTQDAIAQTAYTKALINVTGCPKISDEVRYGFAKWILSYWNNVVPNKGNLVLAQLGGFSRKLNESLSCVLTGDVIVIPVVDKVTGTDDVDYTKLEAYAELIQTLVDEANKHFAQYKENIGV
jgi:hypothetical protein